MRTLIIFLILAPLFSFSQNDGVYGGCGFFEVGYFNIDNMAINGYLTNNQLPVMDKNGVTLGGKGFGVINDMIIGGEGGTLLANKAANSNASVEMGSGYGMLCLGYMMPVRSRLNIYPIIGWGWGGKDLTITNNSGTKDSYNSSCMFLKTEINLDLFMFHDKEKQEKAGFMTGLSIGYMFNIQNDPWKDQNKYFASIPNNYLNGFYLKLKIGGGGMGKAKSKQ